MPDSRASPSPCKGGIHDVVIVSMFSIILSSNTSWIPARIKYEQAFRGNDNLKNTRHEISHTCQTSMLAIVSLQRPIC